MCCGAKCFGVDTLEVAVFYGSTSNYKVTKATKNEELKLAKFPTVCSIKCTMDQ